MPKTEHSESDTEPCWESDSASAEDSKVDIHNNYFLDDEDNDRVSDIVGNSEQDGHAEEDKDQDAGTNGHEHKDQRTDTDKKESENHNPEQGKGEDEALNESLDLSGGKQSARNGDTIDISTLSTPQVSKPDPSPAPKSHHETIALGQHHLWMI